MNLNNLETPKSRVMASKLSNMKETAKHNDSEFLNEINKNKDEKQLARRIETNKSLKNKRESSNLKTQELKKSIQENITNCP